MAGTSLCPLHEQGSLVPNYVSSQSHFSKSNKHVIFYFLFIYVSISNWLGHGIGTGLETEDLHCPYRRNKDHLSPTLSQTLSQANHILATKINILFFIYLFI
ncbi:hypothetical protein Lalb_Chr16g0381731 [Lupinus albus]|uniref:Uncharacterized protein n=1 Tax=Lupinus albus TaxID=3870 RepID=A0A6A4PBE3_LUPAL|nr:hypothetical protein Lalb_Chr16g0381731 [Lupinus albus]